MCTLQEHLRDVCLVGDAGEAQHAEGQTNSRMQDEVDFFVRNAQLVQAQPGVCVCVAGCCVLLAAPACM